ncbi:MAG: twin-arginine translocase subunit TatB [Proteobacteria bacterium]|nr:twin-arginine translocase subunit TatB [Pseudomonadota bacterium]HQR03973.1 Sec-independent protein translocase protein TatB [Rhodocyclaceae bacterium]
MFDVGFSELVVIGVVALVVIGPERLPRVARTAGALLGRAQRYFNDVKAEVNRELQLEELRKLQQEMAEQARKIESQATQVETRIRSDLEALEDEVKTRPQNDPPSAGTAPAPPAKS